MSSCISHHLEVLLYIGKSATRYSWALPSPTETRILAFITRGLGRIEKITSNPATKRKRRAYHLCRRWLRSRRLDCDGKNLYGVREIGENAISSRAPHALFPLANHLCSSQRLLNSYYCQLYLRKNVYSISFTTSARYLFSRFCQDAPVFSRESKKTISEVKLTSPRCEKRT